MNTSKPLVSIIIPTYNRAHSIGRCLNSVLSQSYKNLEVIVVDDGSQDDTERIVKSYNADEIIYIQLKQNTGAAGARNIGIRKSTGDLISFLDSDDTLHPQKIEKQVNAILNAAPGVGAVYCGINLVDYGTGEIFGQRIHKENFLENFRHGKYFLTPTTGTVLARREAVLSTGGFDETLPAHQDTEFAIRFCQKYDYLLIDEFLVNAGKNHNQISSNPSNHIKAKEIIFKKHYNFLSKEILYGLCKQLANFYTKKEENTKAKYYIKEAFEMYPFKFITLLQLIFVNLSPRLLKLIYNLKNQ